MRLVLCLLAVAAFAALPVYAQHGGGHGGGAGGPGAGMGSSHSAADSHDNHSAAANTHSGAKTPDQLLSQNSQLSKKLLSFFPAGTTQAQLEQAAQGFKNLGQFVAAVHVSNNLGIPFDQLKAKMIGPPKESLGQAIHALKPAANSTEESKKGEKQAKQDMDDSKAS